MEKCACKGSFLERFIQPAILMCLATENLHGFSLLKKLSEEKYISSGGAVDPTGLYRTLKKMETAGLLTSEWDMESAAQPRKTYAITDEGRKCLVNWETTLYGYRNSIDRLARSISDVLDHDPACRAKCLCSAKHKK